MAKEQIDTPLSDDTVQINEVETLLVASPGMTAQVEKPSDDDKSADSAQSSAQEVMNLASTSSVQSTSARPLFKTPEGRIAAFKRMLEKNTIPDSRVNLEALIRYYKEGGKVPEGDEEVWAVEGQVSFGTRNYTSFDQMPEGWLFKNKFVDVSALPWPRLVSILLRSQC